MLMCACAYVRVYAKDIDILVTSDFGVASYRKRFSNIQEVRHIVVE